jgi:hypothetical protein
MTVQRFGTTIFALLLAIAFLRALAQSGESTSTAFADQHIIRQQLVEMIQQAIQRSTFSLPGGGTATTVPLLSAEDYEKAKQFGDRATPALAEYLQSKQFFEQLLAIRLLNVIGTDASKDVLGRFAEKAALVPTRSYALDFVAASGRTKDMALLEKIATTDSDVHVRTRAIDLLQQYKKEHSP